MPISTVRTYLDYISHISNGDDIYPSNLDIAHNIQDRNYDIGKNKDICDKFESVVNEFKKYEYQDSKFALIAPVRAQDLVDEGRELHHCVATYIPLVANNISKVM
jgi:hypothetical protein